MEMNDGSPGMLRPLLNDYLNVNTCPDLISLDDYQQAQLSEAEQAEISLHVENCQACQAKLAQISPPLDLPDWHLPAAVAMHTQTHNSLTPAPGQLWTLAESLNLPKELIPSTPDTAASAATVGPCVWLILEVGPLHFGRYQEVLLAPLSEMLAFASDRDVILNAADMPFAESLMVESWNAQRCLSDVLGQYLGNLSAEALEFARLAQLNQPHRGLRGGAPSGPNSLVYDFQAQEKKATAPLAAVYDAFQSLRRSAAQAFVYITPQGLKSPAETQNSPFFAQLHGQSQAPVWAAASHVPPTQSHESAKARLTLSETLGLEFWLDSKNLVFFCFGPEQESIQGLEIHYLTPENTPAQVSTNRWGSAQISLTQLRPAESLMEFRYQNQTWRYPFFRGDSPPATHTETQA